MSVLHKMRNLYFYPQDIEGCLKKKKTYRSDSAILSRSMSCVFTFLIAFMALFRIFFSSFM